VEQPVDRRKREQDTDSDQHTDVVHTVTRVDTAPSAPRAVRSTAHASRKLAAVRSAFPVSDPAAVPIAAHSSITGLASTATIARPRVVERPRLRHPADEAVDHRHAEH
jgi:hypothetical protein